MKRIYPPFALKLYAFGLSRLLDWNWASTELYHFVTDHHKGYRKPTCMLKNPLQEGFLFHLGIFLYDEFVKDHDKFQTWDTEDLSWYLEDFVSSLVWAGCNEKNNNIKNTIQLLEQIDALYDVGNDNVYYDKLEESRKHFLTLHQNILKDFKTNMNSITDFYAANYSDRVFHDRELCGYISQLFITVGLTDEDAEGNPCQWANRCQFPEWVKVSLRARERGKCALCGSDIFLELEDDTHVDHIVPLSKGGCNDLVNLQILCKKCNLSKSNKKIFARSSVPPYISRKINR
jgi:hypothetical protein